MVEKQKDVGMSQLSPNRASVAVPEMAECFASLRLSVFGETFDRRRIGFAEK
jgi:hypothetical protein